MVEVRDAKIGRLLETLQSNSPSGHRNDEMYCALDIEYFFQSSAPKFTLNANIYNIFVVDYFQALFVQLWTFMAHEFAFRH